MRPAILLTAAMLAAWATPDGVLANPVPPAAPATTLGSPVRVADDPPGFYAPTFYRERGLTRSSGGFDAEAQDWVKPFQEYVASKPLRPTPSRRTVYLLPLGPVDEKMATRIGLVRAFLTVYLTLPVRTLPAAGLVGCRSRPAEVTGQSVEQYEAGHLMTHLVAPRQSADALTVIGLATVDLYAADRDWPSLAHLARTGEGLGVCSLARTFPEFFGRRSKPDMVYRDRRLAFSMVADTACRTLGLTPCRKYYCVMNQVRRSSTTEPLHLCPDCLRKLRWTLRFDVIARYETLERFYREVGMPVEGTWVRRRLGECRRALAEKRNRK